MTRASPCTRRCPDPTPRLSSAGKTTYARAFARREGAVPFILDEWGARLFGPDVRGLIELPWMLERLGRCVQLIWSTAVGVLTAGTSVILDTGLMRRADREGMREMAKASGLSIQWHFVDTPQEVRRARVAARVSSSGGLGSKSPVEEIRQCSLASPRASP